jgi:hypothetical protein
VVCQSDHGVTRVAHAFRSGTATSGVPSAATKPLGEHLRTAHKITLAAGARTLVRLHVFRVLYRELRSGLPADARKASQASDHTSEGPLPPFTAAASGGRRAGAGGGVAEEGDLHLIQGRLPVRDPRVELVDTDDLDAVVDV